MIGAVKRIYYNPKYAKIFHWTKLIAITGSAQAIVQATSLLCGILVIRLLPTQEYAWYTLANTMLGTMSVLADGGISAGVMALSGKVWQDGDKMGVILATGLDLRKKFAIVSLLVAIPILVYLLLQNGAGWLTVILITACLMPAFFAALSDSLLEIIPRLKQDIAALQKNQLTVAVGRLLLSGVTLFLFPFTFIAIFAAGMPRIYGNIRLSKIVDTFVNKDQKPDADIRKNILKIVKRLLPGSIYYCLSGQIIIWLASFFGNTSSIAQIGALGRLAMVLSLFSVLFNTLVTPRFARLPNDRSILLNRYLKILVGLIFFGIVIISICYIFSTQALWILGNKYKNLKNEFILSMIAGYIVMFAGVLFSINTSRGWTINPFFWIPFNIVIIGLGTMLFDISSIKGLFAFNIIIMAVEVIIYTAYGLRRILKFSPFNNNTFKFSQN